VGPGGARGAADRSSWDRGLVAGTIGVAILGAWLRFHRIEQQIVFGDEVHAIYQLLEGSYARIFATLHEHDHCIPLTLLLKAIGAGVGLDEVTTRLPSLVAGVGLILIAPLLARPLLDRRAAFLFAGLLAISPELVYFSRYARPYSIATLFVVMAVLAMLRWLDTGRRSFAVLYAASGVAAIWFHLLAAPAVLSPLALAVLAARRAREGEEDERRMRTLLLTGLGLAGGLVLLLAIPFWNGLDVLVDKAGQTTPTWHTARAVLTSIPGTVQKATSPGRHLTWPFWAAVAAGAAILLRRSRLAALTLLATSLVQVAAVVILAPSLSHFYDTFLRYVAWLVPFCLLFLAVALSAAVKPLERLGPGRLGGLAATALGAGVVALLFELGTWRCSYATQGNWAIKKALLAACTWGRAPGDWSYPAVYDRLAAQPGRFTLVETPWFDWWEDRYHWYQKVHGKDTLIGFAAPVDGVYTVPHFHPARPALRFRRFVDLLDAPGLQRRGVRYVLFHKNLAREMRYTTDMFDARLDVQPTIDLYRTRYGEPVFEDGDVALFDVARGSPGSPRR
jgi:hypothetical protein